MLNQELENKIQQYINEFMKIPEFKQGFKQTHHYNTTVSDHSIHVAIISAKICYYLNKMGMHFAIDGVIRVSLLHDVGIVGARKKTIKEMDGHCLAIYHPLKSVEIAENTLLDLTDREKNIIETHMFPLSQHFPKYKESWLIVISDKVAFTKDILGYKEQIRTKLCENI